MASQDLEDQPDKTASYLMKFYPVDPDLLIKINKQLKLFFVVSKILLRVLFSRLDSNIYEESIKLLSAYNAKVNLWMSTRGNLETIAMLKRHRVSIYRFLAGSPHKFTGVGYYKNGLPKLLGLRFRDLVASGDVNAIRVVLSILQIARIIPGWKKIDLKPIYLPPRTDFSQLQNEFKFFLVAYQVLPTKPFVVWDDFHTTTRMGPNGPALSTATFDWPLFVNRYQHLFPILNKWMNKMFINVIPMAEHYHHWPSILKDFAKTNPVLRRLSTVDDKEGKLRVIGICDYWSQTVLKPIHTHLLWVLSTFKESDMTVGQDIKPFGCSSQNYWSIDLTSATDRFPMSLQTCVIDKLFGESVAKAWKELLVGEPFMYNGKNYSYACGQPMGAYSSWAGFSVTHHVLIQFCAFKALGKPSLPFKDYRMLGDDVVIRNDLVAQKYLECLETLGVDVSPEKTLVSPHSFEFAKRYFHHDVEVTAFPIGGICNTVKGVTELLMVLKESTRRGYPDLFKENPEFILEFYKALRNSQLKGFKTFSIDFIEKLHRKAVAFWIYLSRLEDISLLRYHLSYLGKEDLVKHLTDERLVKFTKSFLSRGIIQNQTELIFKTQGMMCDVASGLPEDMKEYFKLQMPVMFILQGEYLKLVDNVETLNNNLSNWPLDYDQILYRSFIELEVNPTQVIGTERRVQAKKAQAKAVSLGFKYLKDEVLNMSHVDCELNTLW